MRQPDISDTVSVYWQTGCTSCLRVKEYLTAKGVAFRSRDVLADPAALDELTRFGLRQVPIVVRGDRWANGQILRDVAELCGLPWGDATLLPPQELRRRINAILAATARQTRQMPAALLQRHLPERPRSYADLSYHISNIVDAFVEQEEGIALVYEAYYRTPPVPMQTPEGLADYAAHVAGRLNRWFDGDGATADWKAPAQVYYGAQTRHEFLERTAWHAGQHARQLAWVLEANGIPPEGKLGPETFAGLPMPAQIWEDGKTGALAPPA